jgi:hypothetical protein
MQHHPDPAELMSYLLDKTQATVANDVIEHLLVCERCIRHVNLHREFLSAEHAELRKPSTDSENGPAFATFTRYAMQPYGGSGSHFAWALLVPLVLAVGLQSSTSTDFGRTANIARVQPMRTLHPVVKMPVSTAVSGVEADDPSLQPVPVVRVLARRPEVPVQRIAKRFTPHPSRPVLRHPVLLEPARDHNPVFRTIALNNTEALTLVSDDDFELAPPPRRPAMFKRVVSAIIAPFRKS